MFIIGARFLRVVRKIFAVAKLQLTMFLRGTSLLKYLTIDSTKLRITIDYKSKSAAVAVPSALHVPVAVADVPENIVNLMKTLKFRSTKKYSMQMHLYLILYISQYTVDDYKYIKCNNRIHNANKTTFIKRMSTKFKFRPLHSYTNTSAQTQPHTLN